MKAFKYGCVFSACLLTACATHRLTPEQPLQTQETQPLTGKNAKAVTQASAVTSWEISGAMAARNNTNKGWTASTNWVQQGPNQYHIRLFGPLGGGTVIIEKNGGVITYIDGPKRTTSRNADDLLQKQTGIRLPVQNLYYWVRGLPAPGAVQSSQRDGNNHLSLLRQGGYTIQYANYTSVNGVDLPGKVALQGHGVVVKLVIKQWRI